MIHDAQSWIVDSSQDYLPPPQKKKKDLISNRFKLFEHFFFKFVAINLNEWVKSRPNIPRHLKPYL